MARKALVLRHQTFDIETHDWTRFLLGTTWGDNGNYLTRDEDRLVDHMLAEPGVCWWSHNGGKFDMLWLLGHLQARGIHPEIVCAGASVISVTVGRGAGRIVWRDSMALVPYSLKKFAPFAGPENQKSELPTLRTDDLPSKEELTSSQWSELGHYCLKDSQVLHAALSSLRAYCCEHGIVQRSTIGSTSWATAKAHYELPDFSASPGLYSLARRGYYGGRCEVFQTESSGPGRRYDRNSSYPAALHNCDLLSPPLRSLASSVAGRAFRAGRAGVYGAIVHVPVMEHPPLPWRNNGRLFFPTGRLVGAWERRELEYAERKCGVRIERILWGLIGTGPDKMHLKDWAAWVWSLRGAELAKGKDDLQGKARALWLKWLANSLTGKLAQRPDKEKVFIPTDEKPPACNGKDHSGPCPENRCCIHRCVGTCGRWKSLDGGRGVWWSRPMWRLDPNAHCYWAASLTAEARVSQHERFTSDSVYGDTDSNYRVGSDHGAHLGDDLGQWKDEGGWEQWRAVAPKVYQYRDGGRLLKKAKGFPGWHDDPREIDEIITGEYRWKHAGTLKRALASTGGPWALVRQHRQVHIDAYWVGGRVRDHGSRTRPPTIREAHKRPR